MSDMGDAAVEVPVEVENVDSLETAIPLVLKKALRHDGVVRGLHQVAKALDAKKVKICCLAQSCEEEAYKNLVIALCKTNNVPLVEVPDAKELGKWSGLCKYDRDGEARKIVGAACVAITDVGEDSQALTFLKEHIKNPK